MSRRILNVNAAGLFPYYIADPLKWTERDLMLLDRYQILADLDSELYHSNCFIYAMEQYRVPSDKIEIAKAHVTSVYIKTKDIGKVGEATGLGFLIPHTKTSRLQKSQRRLHTR